MKSYANVQNYFVNYQHLLLYNVKDSRRGLETAVFVNFMLYPSGAAGIGMHAPEDRSVLYVFPFTSTMQAPLPLTWSSDGFSEPAMFISR